MIIMLVSKSANWAHSFDTRHDPILEKEFTPHFRMHLPLSTTQNKLPLATGKGSRTTYCQRNLLSSFMVDRQTDVLEKLV